MLFIIDSEYYYLFTKQKLTGNISHWNVDTLELFLAVLTYLFSPTSLYRNSIMNVKQL